MPFLNKSPNCKAGMLQQTIVTGWLIIILSVMNDTCFSQSLKKDAGSGPAFNLSGKVTVTNNGLSFIPAFTLGKPAWIFDGSIGKSNLRFEPQLRFSLDGKPWSMLLWWRYPLLKRDNWRITLGAHPGFAFKTIRYMSDKTEKSDMVVHEYLAGEVAPQYTLGKKASIGLYYLYSHGTDPGAVQHTHFITVNSTLNDIRLSKGLSFRINPQLYYLKMDRNDGVYASAVLAIEHRKFPIALTSMMNKSIRTRITAGQPFAWNISLVYSFRKVLEEK